MAQITIGLGFMRTPDQEKEWRRAAAALPEKWVITMSGDPATHIFDVRTKGPGVDASKTFGPDDADVVLQYLESIKPAKP
jgi:hypothetical protein